MLGFVIFLSVLSSIALSISGSSRHSRLDDVVRLLQNQLNNDKTSSSDSSSSDDNIQNLVGQNLNPTDIINLLKQANRDKEQIQSRFKIEKDRQKYRNTPNSLKKYIQNFQNQPERDINNVKLKNVIWEKILNLEQKPRTSKKKQRVSPNRLLSPTKYAYENEDRQNKKNYDGLSQYSKIFIVLDPIALQNSKNKNDVQSLLTEILEKSSSAIEKSRQDRTELNHYKGFVVRDNPKSRRYRKSSEDDEDEYRPKRGRDNHGGGGGGGGGRTAIPYIRNRGDIYEKEH